VRDSFHDPDSHYDHTDREQQIDHKIHCSQGGARLLDLCSEKLMEDVEDEIERCDYEHAALNSPRGIRILDGHARDIS
jgi:hypothetical protein